MSDDRRAAARSGSDRRSRGPAIRATARSATLCSRAARSGCALCRRRTSSAPICASSPGSRDAQHAIQDGLPSPTCRPRMHRERAREFGMPPLDRGRFAADAGVRRRRSTGCSLRRRRSTCRRRRARRSRGVPGMPMRRRATRWSARVLADAIPVEALAEHVFVAAALQVHFARLAARLDASRAGAGRRWCLSGLRRAAGRLDGRRLARRARRALCACSLCGTLWNYVRIKCTLCGSTKGIGYQEIEGGPGTSRPRPARMPRLREDPVPAQGSGARAGRRRCRDARPRSAGARSRLPARRRSIRSCSAIEAQRWTDGPLSDLRSLPSVDRGAADAGRARRRSSASAGRRSSDAVRDALARARAARSGDRRSPRCGRHAALARLEAEATIRACGRSSTSPARCCTPISAARCSPRRRSRRRSQAMRNAVALEFDLGDGQARRTRRSSARPALRTDRRRGRDRRQQQCRRRAARAQHAGAAAARRSSRAAN